MTVILAAATLLLMARIQLGGASTACRNPVDDGGVSVVACHQILVLRSPGCYDFSYTVLRIESAQCLDV